MKISQESSILQHLQLGQSLDPMKALQKFGCFRLGARCYDLKRKGYPIKTRLIHSNGKTYAQYYMEMPTSSTMPSSEIVEPAPTSEQKIEYKVETDGQLSLI